MKEIEFFINAGLHDRFFVPFRFLLSKENLPDEIESVVLLDLSTNTVFPVQYLAIDNSIEFSFIFPFLKAYEKRKLKLLINGEREIGYSNIRTEDTGKEIRVYVDDFHAISYRYIDVVKPYIYPVRVSNGMSITDDGPKDHPHHRSLYVAHGDINGVDVWSEGPDHGYIRHGLFKRIVSGPVYAQIEAINTWTDKYGNPLLEETRIVRLWNIPSKDWFIDFNIELVAKYGDIKFGDTKEGGILSVRVAPTVTVSSGYGKIVNSWNGINEREVWGKRAMWCDYTGKLGNDIYGIAVFDNIRNFRYPTYWHARDYGLMTANMFGWTYFTGDKTNRGDYLLEKGKSLKFSYRVYVHKGDHKDARVSEVFINYIYPPLIEF